MERVLPENTKSPGDKILLGLPGELICSLRSIQGISGWGFEMYYLQEITLPSISVIVNSELDSLLNSGCQTEAWLLID